VSRGSQIDVALSTAALALDAFVALRPAKPVEAAVARVGSGVLRSAGDLVLTIEDGWSSATPDAVGQLVADLICEIKPLASNEAQARRVRRVRNGWSETAEIVREWFTAVAS
jgi:hypothetical protein